MYVFLQNRNLIWNQFKSCVGNEKLTFVYQRILFECNKMSGIFSNSKNVCFSYKLNANSKSKSGPYFCQKIVIKVSWPKIGLRQKLRGNVLRLSADKSRTEQNILFFYSWKKQKKTHHLKKFVKNMKVQTPQIAWHNRDRVSSVSIQPFAYPTPCKEGGTRIATGGDDTHVVVSDTYLIKFLCSEILPKF